MSSESDSDASVSDWEMDCCSAQGCSRLPFDPTELQDVILSISDRFDFRVIMSEGKAKNALIITTGLTIAGTVIGRRYGGNIGAALGGAMGGACGLGIAAVSMREVWDDVKSKLSELFEIAYDYLAGLGLRDYQAAAALVACGGGDSKHLALLLADMASKLLDKKVVSSITHGSP
ncbi:uncharacterized protein LOC126380389 [Pectinophora gossypiella]|uniref:uncharacterized protein LOC126380389 n=1 Tax=Pectinophora gossypiella TaxID=13191 RepID=UPI00214F0622|nr:uncharacterized protein LOC126380389 [Pectinophora gossypiella]